MQKRWPGGQCLTHKFYKAAHMTTIGAQKRTDRTSPLIQVMMKSADDVSLEERCLTHSLAQACVLFSQGIAFLHAGDELLRSKSLDRDGYNSGMLAFLAST